MVFTRKSILSGLRTWLLFSVFIGLLPLFVFSLVVFSISPNPSYSTFINVLQRGGLVAAGFGLYAGSLRRAMTGFSRIPLSARRYSRLLVGFASVMGALICAFELGFISVASTIGMQLDPGRIAVFSTILYLTALFGSAIAEIVDGSFAQDRPS